MTTKREIERKYDVPVNFAIPDLTELQGVAAMGRPAEHRLDATYYDTPGMDLARHRMTLRRRTGGTDAGWHLKRPAGDGERLETQVPLDAGSAVPAAVADEVRTVAGDAPLRPVAHIRTRRVERALTAPDGTVLALVADDVVAAETPGDPTLLQQWRELEVELVDGELPLIDAIDAALRAAGAGPAGYPSKLVRALGDRQPDPGPDPGPGPAPADRLRDYLREQRDAMRDNESGVRAGDADAVHDMRVATRRLRSTLRTFRSRLGGAERTDPLRDELKWLADALGGVRDGDVMAARLREAVAAEPAELVVGPVGARIDQRLTAEIAEARTGLTAALDSDRRAALVESLDALIDAPPSGDVTGPWLRRRARKALRRADRRLAAAKKVDDGRDERLHEARKAYKRARYAVEVLRPSAGKPARRLAKRLSTVQDVLGAHQDSIVTGKLLHSYGMRAHEDGENAFTYGLLHARQRQAGEASLAGLPRAVRRAGRRAVRRWLKK